MKFKSYLAEEKNVHMEHVEDLMFNEGVDGTRKAINFLRDIRDTLSGHTVRKSNFTVKWDGAPAIFAGVDPNDGKFFVAKKGIFNKSPQLFKTEGDIDRILSGDLAEKFKYSLREFKKLGIKSGVIQGDLMFTSADLRAESIDGTEYITFQPNTIVYAIPKGSNLAKEIQAAEIGVVWHTSYSGDSFENMKASFGKNIVGTLRKTKTVWQDDANYKDVSGTATFTARETKDFNLLLSQSGRQFRTIKAIAPNTIAASKEMRDRFKAFNNSMVRGTGIPFNNVRQPLLKYFNEYFDKEIAKKSSPAAVKTWTDKKNTTIGFITKNIRSIESMYRLMGTLTQAKHIVVNKLNQGSSLPTFLRTAYGFKVTDPEGFVAIDHLSNGAVKLVNRMEFSRANFSSDIIKGWER